MEQPLVCLVCITVCVSFSEGLRHTNVKLTDKPGSVIHLGQQSLTGSSSLPGFSTGRTM